MNRYFGSPEGEIRVCVSEDNGIHWSAQKTFADVKEAQNYVMGVRVGSYVQVFLPDGNILMGWKNRAGRRRNAWDNYGGLRCWLPLK